MLFRYPYTDSDKINLDWLIAKIKEVTNTLDEYVALNKLTWKGTWNIGDAYPIWSIVDDNGDGYVSIKPVPRNVEITNTEYWQMVANYSGLYSAFEQRIKALENDSIIVHSDINGINTRLNGINTRLDADDLILIGDSYGLDSSAGGKSWASIVTDCYPNAYKAVVGGTGFGSDVYISDNWLSMLQGLNVPDKNTVKKIICVGGANDANLLYDGRLTTSVLDSRISEFIEYAKVEYPNAKVCVGFVGWYYDNDRFDSYINCANVYMNSVNKVGGKYFNDGRYIMHNTLNINHSDFIHPTQRGSNYLGEFALSIIADSDYYYKDKAVPTITESTGLTVDTNSWSIDYDHDEAVLNLIGISSNLYSTFTFTVEGQNNDFQIKLDGVPYGNKTPIITHSNLICGNNSAPGTFNLPVVITLQNHGLIFHVINPQGKDIKVALLLNTSIRIPLVNN